MPSNHDFQKTIADSASAIEPMPKTPIPNEKVDKSIQIQCEPGILPVDEARRVEEIKQREDAVVERERSVEAMELQLRKELQREGSGARIEKVKPIKSNGNEDNEGAGLSVRV